MNRILSSTIGKYFLILVAIFYVQIAFAQQQIPAGPSGTGGAGGPPGGDQAGGGGPGSGVPAQPPLMDEKALSAYTHKWLDLPYASKSEKQKLDIYLPNEGTGPFPVIVRVHGGGWLVTDKRTSGTEVVLDNALKHGYALVSVNYRYYSEAIFPAQVEDVKAAVRWLRANGSKYQLNTQKIGVWGESAGGYLVAMMGTSNGVSKFDNPNLGNADQSSSVQAVVNVSGPIDLGRMDDELIVTGFTSYRKHNPAGTAESNLLGGEALQSIPDKVKAANPETYISKNSAPALLLYGMKDDSISYMQATSLAQKLMDAIGSDKVQLVLFPEEGHGGPDSFSTEANGNMNRIFTFFDTYIKSGGSEASGNNLGKVRKTYKVDKFFAEVNKSKSGKITKEEWKAAGLPDILFPFVDQKNQGYIDIDELKVAVFPIEIDTDMTGELTLAKLLAYEKLRAGGSQGGGAPQK